MQYSATGQLLTQGFEGCKLQAYLDSAGVPTIAYGHTAGVQLGDTCTPVQANEWLLQDVAGAVYAVNHYVAIHLSQNEFDALVDFVFNEGAGHFASSTMLAKLNRGDLVGAANEFEKWDMAGGVAVAGLLRRRKAEEVEFDGTKPL